MTASGAGLAGLACRRAEQVGNVRQTGVPSRICSIGRELERCSELPLGK